MTNAEIFNRSATEIMTQWDILKFKKSHPTLLRSILVAMNRARIDEVRNKE